MNESHFDYVDDPAVAVAGDGQVAVAWVDQARRSVLLQRYAVDGEALFRPPVMLPSMPGVFSWLPRLAIPADDPRRVYALWQAIVFSGGSHGGEIFFSRSADGGATFGAPLNLSNSRAGDGKGRLTAKRWDNGSLALVAGREGRIYAAWTEYEGRLWVRRSTDGGASFADPLHVAGDQDHAARAPALAVDRAGTVHLAWSAGQGAGAVVRIAHSRDGGRSFRSAQAVPSRGHADAPAIAADTHGNLHLVFAESPGGRDGPYRIRYARQDIGRDAFSEPKTIATGAGGAHFPDLAVDGSGLLHVVWKVFREPARPSHGIGFTLSNDGGRTFAAPGIVPESADPALGFSGSLQGGLMARLAVNHAGALALAGSTFAPGRSSRIWLWRRPADPRPSPPSPRP